jgi:hypothetical protein
LVIGFLLFFLYFFSLSLRFYYLVINLLEKAIKAYTVIWIIEVRYLLFELQISRNDVLIKLLEEQIKAWTLRWIKPV